MKKVVLIMFFKTSALLAVISTLGACAYAPQDITASMPPLQLADGSVQQTTMAAVYDKNCVGPTVVQLITYHAPKGSMKLAPIASGTVSGKGQCVALMMAGSRLIGYAMLEGTDIAVNSLSVASTSAVAIANAG